LISQKINLERDKERFRGWIWILGAISIILSGGLFYYIRKQKRLNKRYKELSETLKGHVGKPIIEQAFTENKSKVSLLDQKIISDLLVRLNKFESKNDFTEKGWTLQKWASKLNTNSAYLSQVVNEYKGGNFSQ